MHAAVIEAPTGAEVALDAPGNCVESARSNLTSLAALGYVRPADAPHACWRPPEAVAQ
jgi:hypothetical protein